MICVLTLFKHKTIRIAWYFMDIIPVIHYRELY